MARRGDCFRADLSSLPSGGYLCNGCRVYRCRKSTALIPASLFAWAQGKLPECDDYQPRYFRGLEGVRP